jgi:hypothetical protein
MTDPAESNVVPLFPPNAVDDPQAFADFCKQLAEIGEKARDFANYGQRLARVRPRMASSAPPAATADIVKSAEALLEVDPEDEVELDRCRTRLLLTLEQATTEAAGSGKHSLSLVHDALAWTWPLPTLDTLRGILLDAISPSTEYMNIRRALLDAGFRVSPPVA